MSELKGKTVDESAVHEHISRVFPDELNAMGTVFGGHIMATLDRVCSIVAERHSGGAICVTASVDSMHFLSPARKGEILIYMAAVNRSWRSSMEIGAKVVAHNYRTGERKNIVSAYFTFVALGDNQKPIPVPPVIPQTAVEKERYEAADRRREGRRIEKRLQEQNLE